MKIVELDIRVPYESRGRILRHILSKVRGRIRDIHFFPPDSRGISEVRMEVIEENPSPLLAELKRLLKGGGITFRVFTEA